MIVADLLASLNDVFPFMNASSWDPVGLQLGDHRNEIGRVGVTHEITNEVVESALSGSFTTLVTYHPLLFTPITKITAGSNATGRALRLLEGGMSVIVVHTAMDAAPNGTADALLDAIGVDVTGSFGETDPGASSRIGRYGSLRSPVPVGAFVEAIEASLMTSVHIGGDLDASIATVAAVPGSGGSFITEAAGLADVYVTGDVSHHRARSGIELGLTIIDAGHIPTERPGVAHLYDSVRDLISDAVFIAGDPHPWKDVSWKI